MNQSDSRTMQNLSLIEMRRLELDRVKAERHEKTALYFIQAQVTGLIKIGIALKPRERLAALQIGSPDKLVLLGVVRQPGARAVERALHAAMKEHRSHGEWFRPAPALLQYIADNAR